MLVFLVSLVVLDSLFLLIIKFFLGPSLLIIYLGMILSIILLIISIVRIAFLRSIISIWKWNTINIGAFFIYGWYILFNVATWKILVNRNFIILALEGVFIVRNVSILAVVIFKFANIISTLRIIFFFKSVRCQTNMFIQW